jgi:chloramphenicol O-acetyltransferase type A
VAWGKFFAQGKRWQLPLSVQGHHALMDGLHLGRYFEQVQALLEHPEYLLTSVPQKAERSASMLAPEVHNR